MGLFSKGETVTFTVPEMNCDHCVAKVTAAMQELPGIRKVDADHGTKKLTLTYRGETPTLEAVNARLEPKGYVAE